MAQMLLVTLREGIEMFLIVALAATYLRKSGRAALLSAVGWGTAMAVAASVVLGTWLAEVAVLPKWEALLALVAAVLVISRSEEHTSELQSQSNLVCRLLLEKKKKAPDRNQIPFNSTDTTTPNAAFCALKKTTAQ